MNELVAKLAVCRPKPLAVRVFDDDHRLIVDDFETTEDLLADGRQQEFLRVIHFVFEIDGVFDLGLF